MGATVRATLLAGRFNNRVVVVAVSMNTFPMIVVVVFGPPDTCSPGFETCAS